MKKFLPLIIILAILYGAGGKLLLAQQYCLLCLSKATAALALAPNYLPDSFATPLPFLFK